MNIKLKALLITLATVASPFVFLYMLFTHPAVIFFAGASVLIYLVYKVVLNHLEVKELKGPR
jgi:uncharacterized membrane protein YesL